MSLLYLTHSRPDISYVVSVGARYMQDPHELHWKESKRILHYVQVTRDYRIHYSVDAELYLISYTVSDSSGDGNDRKSNSCFMFMLGLGQFVGPVRRKKLLHYLQKK